MGAIKDLNFFGLSDIGFKRPRNEDAYLAFRLPRSNSVNRISGGLFAVADGIGGNACRDLASRTACQRFEALFNISKGGLLPAQYEKKLNRIFRSIDKEIRRQTIENPACTNMGTTLSALVLFDDFGVIGHVGDSRIYRMREGRLTQLTTDHTFAQDMIAEGDLPPESTKTHPLRNMLTRAVGTQEPLDGVQTLVLDVAAGDRLMLSTDGLHSPVSNIQIASILEEGADPKQSAEWLLKAALDTGGNDNVTVIVIHL